MSRVPVNVVVCQLMMYSNVIVCITISRGSFVSSQSRVNASINSSSAHSPRATVGHLLTLSVPGVGHPQFYRGLGAGHLRTRGNPRAFDTRVLESAMDEFIGKEEAFVEQWLVCQGLEKLADVFKGMFSQF